MKIQPSEIVLCIGFFLCLVSAAAESWQYWFIFLVCGIAALVASSYIPKR